MQWLIANMWMAMAAATVLGLLFGFSFRGLLASNRVRRAMVEREIAKTELTQSKAEVEALYAAQRKRKEDAAQAVGGDESLRAELDERESRIAALGDELSAAQAELATLKSEPREENGVAETVATAAAGALAGAALGDDHQEELTQLRDRNAWLEERVVALEADISATGQAGAAVAATPPASDTGPDNEKLRWQAGYLRMRVSSLEEKVVAASAAAASAVPVPDPEPEPATETPAPEPAPESASAELDEELARLRWRNRYLEGRLAYFEQSPDEDEEAVAEAASDAAAPEPETTDPEPEPESEPEPATVAAETSEPEAATPDAEAEPAAEEVRPSEAMLAELDGTQPAEIERPGNGGDDLTAITGIGPRIAEVLNGLGIWTFAQIAEWQPEHATWIENHLSFKGRVARENWVGQAQELMAAA